VVNYYHFQSKERRLKVSRIELVEIQDEETDSNEFEVTE